MNHVNASTVATSVDAHDRNSARRSLELPDPVIAVARVAAEQDAGGADLIGEFLNAETEDDVAVTIRFRTTDVAYTGWTWSVTVALVDPVQPTVSEVVLLPGPDALLPPPWLPWSERIRPGDLGPGDLLLPRPEDPRLVPGYVQSDDPAVEDVAHELGIGRVQVMSRLGRLEAAERWRDGGFGPDAEMAKAAPATCVTCAFYLPLAGSLGAEFGVCGNDMAPADGRVVDCGYGCGAHSEVVIEPVPTGFRESHVDDLVLDVHPRPQVESGIDPAEIEIEPIVHGQPASDAGPGVAGQIDRDPTDPSGAELELIEGSELVVEAEPAELEFAPAESGESHELEFAAGDSQGSWSDAAPTELQFAPAESGESWSESEPAASQPSRSEPSRSEPAGSEPDELEFEPAEPSEPSSESAEPAELEFAQVELGESSREPEEPAELEFAPAEPSEPSRESGPADLELAPAESGESSSEPDEPAQRAFAPGEASEPSSDSGGPTELEFAPGEPSSESGEPTDLELAPAEQSDDSAGPASPDEPDQPAPPDLDPARY